jgi:hypothetical protein
MNGHNGNGVPHNNDIRWIPDDDEDLSQEASSTSSILSTVAGAGNGNGMMYHPHRYDSPVLRSSNTTTIDLQVCMTHHSACH